MIVNGKKVVGVRRPSRTCLILNFVDGSKIELFDKADGAFLDWKEQEVNRELSGGVMVNNATEKSFEKQLLDLLVANATDEVLALPTFDPAMVQAEKQHKQLAFNSGDYSEHLPLPQYDFDAIS